MSSPFLVIRSPKKLPATVLDFEVEEGVVVNGKVKIGGEWYSLAGLKPAFKSVKVADTITIQADYTAPEQIEEIIEQSHNKYIIDLARLMYNSLLERRIISAGDIYDEFQSWFFPASTQPGIAFDEQPFNLARAFSEAWYAIEKISK